MAQLISLVSEQHAADARLIDARESRKDAQRNLSRATDALRAAATRLLLHDGQLASFVAVWGPVSAQEAEQHTDNVGILAQLSDADRREGMHKAVSMLTEIRKHALEALICFVPVTSAPEPWGRVRWEHFGALAEEVTQWQAVYNLIAAQRAIEANELKGRSGAARGAPEGVLGQFPDSARSRATGTSGPESSPELADVLEALIAQERAAKDADVASTAVAAAKQHRSGLIAPAEFRSGVWVLMYLAIAVILPLTILASGPRHFSFTITYVVPGSLIVGMVVLVSFFWRLSRMARRPAIPLDGDQ